jgi:hypothetical protein
MSMHAAVSIGGRREHGCPRHKDKVMARIQPLRFGQQQIDQRPPVEKGEMRPFLMPHSPHFDRPLRDRNSFQCRGFFHESGGERGRTIFKH